MFVLNRAFLKGDADADTHTPAGPALRSSGTGFRAYETPRDCIESNLSALDFVLKATKRAQKGMSLSTKISKDKDKSLRKGWGECVQYYRHTYVKRINDSSL